MFRLQSIRLALLLSAAWAGPVMAADTTTNVNSAPSVTANAAAGDTHTVNINGTVGQGVSQFNDYNLVAVTGSGAGQVVINNNHRIGGSIDFSGLSGGVDLNIGDEAVWRTTRNNAFGAGADSVVIEEGGLLAVGLNFQAETTVINFNGGNDVVDNQGVLLLVGSETGGSDGMDNELRLEGLETFRNSGRIMMGGSSIPAPGERDSETIIGGTDAWNDDILSMPGAHYIGDDGVIVMDVNLNATGQTACDVSLRGAGSDFPAADCVAIIGGSTEGRTYIEVVDLLPGDRGSYNPDGTVLIDVSGGTSAAGDFVLSPDSDHYSASNGGIMDKGYFFYAIAYDEDEQQHKLVGLAGENALQSTLLAPTAQSLWRLSTGSWLGRQADLRGEMEDGVGGGVWLRATTESAEQDLIQSSTGAGTTFDFDNSYEQKSYAVTGGVDLITGGSGDTAYVLGLMAGYIHADVDYQASPSESSYNGWTGGLYASLISGGLFVDAALNANRLTVRNDMPTLNLFPTDTLVSTDLVTLGAQVEAGWRLPLGETVFVEPLASVAWMRTTGEDMNIVPDDPARLGATTEFEDSSSLRASVGARVGLDQDFGAMRAQFSALGRAWNEFDGESGIVIHGIGPDAHVVQEASGTITEVGLGASLYGAGGVVSGFVNLGGKFGDDYQATTASGGVRVAW